MVQLIFRQLRQTQQNSEKALSDQRSAIAGHLFYSYILALNGFIKNIHENI